MNKIISMKRLIIYLLSPVLIKVKSLFDRCQEYFLFSQLGKRGDNSYIFYPFYIKGPNNLHISEGVSIGSGSTIFSTRAKIFIGKNSFSGPNLTMITGSHPYLLKQYMIDVRKDELKDDIDISDYDKDIIIEQDVWIAVNVTILRGVRIGRGAIVAAASLVIKDVPPYSIVGGNPAKVIKFKWSIEEIIEHEKYIYSNSFDRLSTDYLKEVRKEY
jgi:acetyltransferase-like isoleucine patch superfamily enzyme